MVDDRAMPRIAARAMLESAGDLRHVGEAASGREALDLIPKARPDVVLMDVEMSGMDGAATTRSLLERLPTLLILAWTVSETSEDLLRMIQAGCAGYVLKDVGPAELQAAIRAAIRREAPVPRKMLPAVLHSAAKLLPPADPLTAKFTVREMETLRLLAKGAPAKRIAAEMGLSKSSVDTHLRNIYRKLGVNNRADAIRAALRAGTVGLGEL